MSKALQAIELSSLRTFVDLVETKSFTATAQNFYLTQAAVSQQIKKLTNAVNYDLFYFDKKIFKLTVYGSALYHYALRMIELEGDLHRDLLRISGGDKVRVGVHDSFFHSFFADALINFHTQNPSCPVEIQSLSSLETYEAVTAGKLNLGIIIPYDKYFESTYLKTEQLIWVCSKSKQALKTSPIPFALLGKNPKIEDKAIKHASEMGVEIEKIFTCTSYLAIQELIKKDRAISIIPKSCFDSEYMVILNEKQGFVKPSSYDAHLIRSTANYNLNVSLFEKSIIDYFLHGSSELSN